MIGSLVAVAHFARAGKKFKKAMDAAERGIEMHKKSMAAAESWKRAIAAEQAGDVAEQLRQAGANLQTGDLSEEQLMSWNGRLPDGMLGDEKV